MAGKGRRSSSRPSGGGGHKYPRSARVGETLREIIAEELVRIDDERLAFVTVTGIEVDNELNRAHVYFDSLAGEDGDAEIIEALDRAPHAAAVVDRQADPRQEDADPRLPARHRAPVGRAHRGHPPRGSSASWRGVEPATTHGLCVVDKPAGVTSHDVVGMLRRRFGERQVGHAGTLDPDATGVLVVGVGMATRLLRFVEKTDQARTPARSCSASRRRRSTRRARSPPRTTWRRHARRRPAGRGRAPHRRRSCRSRRWCRRSGSTGGACTSWPARASRSSARPRPVTIHRSTSSRAANRACSAIDVACSAGTYIRTLAADLGHLLGGGAHLRNLRRTAVGAFTIDEAAGPDDCELLPVETAVREPRPGRRRRRDGRRWSPTAGCSPRFEHAGRRAVGGVRPTTVSCWPSTSRSGDGQVEARRSCCRRPLRRGSVARRAGRSPIFDVAPFPGRAHRHHDRRLRRRAPRAPGGDRPGARPLAAARGCRARPSSRSTGIRPRSCGPSRRRKLLTDHDQSWSCSRPPASTPPSWCRSTRRRPQESPLSFVERVLVRLPAHRVRRGRRGLPLRPSPRGQRRRCSARSAPTHDFDVEPVELVARADGVDEPVSSTAIRRALAGGNVELAADDARPPVRGARHGRHGDQRGRLLGFPTANVEVPNRVCLPADGVYAGWYERPDGIDAPVCDQPRPAPDVLRARRHSLLEAHLLDFDGDLYGEPAKVQFTDFLRSERKFDGIDALVEQLKHDIDHARGHLAERR